MTDRQTIMLMAKTAASVMDMFDKENPDKELLDKTLYALPIKVFVDEMADRIMNPRGFEAITAFPNTKLPERKTVASAGYDFFAPNSILINAGENRTLHTHVKAFMNPWEVLKIYPRSSMGIKRHLSLVNGVAIIDSDYYNNPDNEGEILICLHNFGSEAQLIMGGERIAQGIFATFESGHDMPELKRVSGIGSTGK